MEPSRQKSPMLQDRAADRTAVRPGSPDLSSLLTLQESLGNQGVLGLLATGRLQRKPAVNQVGDVYEQEANRVAQEVISSPAPPAVQCSVIGKNGPATTSPGIHDVLGSTGQPLDPAARAFFEPRFGRSFSDVRVHSGEQAAEAARSVDALAFTVGRDVVFGAGQYAPGSTDGKRLLAHELTHVMQQQESGASLQRKASYKTTSPKMEPAGDTERALEGHYKFFVDKLTAWWISDDDVDLLLQTLRELRQIDKRYPLVKNNAFAELVIRLRDRKEGNLLEVLFTQIGDDHYQRYPDVIQALTAYLPLAEQLQKIFSALPEALSSSALEEIFSDKTDSFFERTTKKAAAVSLPKLRPYLEAYLEQKAAEIKYYARQGDEDGLRASFRDFYSLYDLLLNLLFGDNLAWGAKRLWQLAKEPDILPKITDPAEKKVTDKKNPNDNPGSTVKGQQRKKNSEDKSGSTTKDIDKKKGSENKSDSTTKHTEDKTDSENKPNLATKMVTDLAEKALQVFEDLSKFSAENPIVIQVANVVVQDFKKIEEKKLTTKLVASKGPDGAAAINTDSLTWGDLVRIWFWQMGPESLRKLSFGQNARTTKDVKGLVGTRAVVKEAWGQVLAGKELKDFARQVNYGPPEFSNSVKNRNEAFNFLGTYTVTVKFKQPVQGAKSVTVHFEVTNEPTLESFSRFRTPGPDGINRPILKNRERKDPGVKIGGTLETRWEWTEELPTSLNTPELRNDIKVLNPDKLRQKPPLISPAMGR